MIQQNSLIFPPAENFSWIRANRLLVRGERGEISDLDVRWLEPVAGPMCRHSYHSPEWDAQTGFVRATEQVY